MIEENDLVITNKRINELIEISTKGVILSIYNNGDAFLIEFINANGETIGNGMETVQKSDIELLVKSKRG